MFEGLVKPLRLILADDFEEDAFACLKDLIVLRAGELGVEVALFLAIDFDATLLDQAANVALALEQFGSAHEVNEFCALFVAGQVAQESFQKWREFRDSVIR